MKSQMQGERFHGCTCGIKKHLIRVLLHTVALTFGSTFAQPSQAASYTTILGNVDGISTESSDAVVLRGWACWQYTSNQSPNVDVYVGGEYDKGGIKIGTYRTDQPTEPAVNQVCGSSNTMHRFMMTFTISMRQQYAGKAIYVYGVPIATYNNYTLLPGSGSFTVPAALAVPDSVYYIHTDRLGSNVIMTDANANVMAKTDYKAYGGASDNQQKNEAPGYTGHYEDPLTGLTYMQQRYYDADLGRFISVDPIGARSGDMFNFNRYAYAHNNPLVFVDPDGRDVGKSEAVHVQGYYFGGSYGLSLTYHYEDFSFFRIPRVSVSVASSGKGTKNLDPVYVVADRPTDQVDVPDAIQGWYCTKGAASVAGATAGGAVTGALTAAANLKGNPYGIASGALLGGVAGGGMRHFANAISQNVGEPSASTFSSMLGSAIADRTPGAFFINGAASFIGSKLEMQKGDIAKMAGRTSPYVIAATGTSALTLGKGALVAGPMFGLAGGLMDYSVEAGWNNLCGN